MAINVGDRLPEATFTVMGSEGPGPQTTQEVFGGKNPLLELSRSKIDDEFVVVVPIPT